MKPPTDRDRIKGLKLCYCGAATVHKGEAVDEVVYCGSRGTRDTLLSLVYYGLCTAAKAAIYIRVSCVLRLPQLAMVGKI